MRNNFYVILIMLLLLSLTACDNPESLVKEGVLNFDKSVTVKDAFENYSYFSETSWLSFKDEQNRNIVEFRGVMDIYSFAGSSLYGNTITEEMALNAKEKLDNKLIFTYIAQFSVSKSDNSFNISYSAFNISGENPETGEAVSKDIPDGNLDIVLSIYRDEPDLNTFGLILGAGGS